MQTRGIRAEKPVKNLPALAGGEVKNDKDFGEKSILSDIHTPGLSFFASATNEVKTRFPCSAACWRNMQIAFRITLL